MRFSRVALSFVVFAGFALLTFSQEKTAVEVAATFKGHTDAVYAVALTPDGKHLLTGSFDSTMKLWDLTGKEIKTYEGPQGHKKMILAIAVSPDGALVASGGTDNSLKIWDVPVNAPIKTYPEPDVVGRIALSPDGTKLAMIGEKGKLSVVTAADFKEISKADVPPAVSLAWNANATFLASAGPSTGDGTLRLSNLPKNETYTLAGHRGGVHQVMINSGTNTAHTVGADGQWRVWTIPQATTQKSLPPGPAPIVASAMGPDNQTLVLAGADKSIRLANIATQKDIRPLPGATADITSVALNAANTLAAAGQVDGKWTLWNATDGKQLGQLLAHNGKINTIAFHPSQPQLASGGADGAITLWALPPVAPRAAAHSSEVLFAVTSPDGKKMTTAAGDKSVRIFDTAKMTLEKQFPAQPAAITSLASLEKIIASGGADGMIRFWNPATGKEADVIAAHAGPVTSLSLGLGNTLLVSTSDDGAVKTWQLPLAAGKTMAHPDQAIGLVLHPDNQKVFTVGADRVIRQWNLGDGAKTRDFAGPTLPIASIAVSNDGKYLAAASADKTVSLWTITDGKLLTKWTVPAAAQAVAFATDNTTLAAGLADGAVKLFKANEPKDKDGKETKEFQTYAVNKGAVTGLAYSPKGDALYVGCANNVVEILTPADGKAKGSLASGGPVTFVALSKDGNKIAAATGKTIKLWAADGKDAGTITVPAEVKTVGLSPDGSRLVAACVDKLVRLYAADGTLIEMFPHDGPALAAAMIDNTKLVSAGADKAARTWASSLRWQKTHAGPVRQGLIASKGDVVVSAGADKTVKLWNTADGKEVRALPATGPVSVLSISPDGTKLAALAGNTVDVWPLVGPADQLAKSVPVKLPQPATAMALTGPLVAVGMGNSVKLLDVAGGREWQHFADHTGPVQWLGVSPDMKTLTTASKDQTAKLLGVAAVASWPAHAGGVTAIQFTSPNTAITGGADKTIRLWDLTKFAETKAIGPLPDPITAVALSKDGQLAVAAAGKHVRIFTVADGKEMIALPHPADVRGFALKADKTRLVTGCADKQTRYFELPTGREWQWFEATDAIESVYLEPNNGTPVITIAGKGVTADAPSIQRSQEVGKGPIFAITMSPAGIVYTAGADKAIRAWNVNTGAAEKITPPDQPAPVRALAVSKAGNLLAAGGDDKIVRVFTLPDCKELASYPVDAVIRDLQFSATNPTLLVNTADKKAIALPVTYNAGQPLPEDFLKPQQIFTPPAPFADVALANDGGSFFAAAPDKGPKETVQLWKIASANPVKSIPHNGNVNAIAFHPKNPTQLITGGGDGRLRIYDVPKAALAKEIVAHADKDKSNAIYTVAFSPDGTKILTSSLDQTMKLHDAASGNLVREFKAYNAKDFPKGHLDEIYAAAFSPDGKTIASGSKRILKIWKTDDGTVLNTFVNPAYKEEAHPAWIYHLRYLNNGRLLSIGDGPKNTGYIGVWNAADGKLLFGETLTHGATYGFAMSPDEKTLAIGCGMRGRATGDLNNAYLLKVTGINR